MVLRINEPYSGCCVIYTCEVGDALMANQEHLDALKQGVESWNKWRKQQPKDQLFDLSGATLDSVSLSGADLSGADLNFATLRGANLRNANLYRADLRGSDLRVTDLRAANLGASDLREADLSNAQLCEANLYGALLSRANLSTANLRGADLRETNLSNTNLHRTIVNEVKIHQTIFAQVDLREALGLTEMIHLGPSHVELYSVQFPQDGSALHFLRGVGLPDEWIGFHRSSTMRPIQYHSCFISYAHQDEMLARRLHADLQDQGVRCWFAPHDMRVGDEIRERIDKEIHIHDKLLLILSEHALASTWVKTEVEAALEKETHQQRSVLFPVRLDESISQASQAWARLLRRARHIGDFTRWTDPRAYQQAFQRLLRDLKAEDDAKGNTNGKPATP
jgi:uncharacterized protein YjbI with pentapeptide repeats